MHSESWENFHHNYIEQSSSCLQKAQLCAALPSTSVTAFDDTAPPQSKRPRRRAYGDQKGPDNKPPEIASDQPRQGNGAKAGHSRDGSQASSQKV